MEELLLSELPSWVKAIAWIIAVAIGVVGFRYYDRRLDHLDIAQNLENERIKAKAEATQQIRSEFIEQMARLSERVNMLETQRDESIERYNKVITELAEYKAKYTYQHLEIERLTKLVNRLEADLGIQSKRTSLIAP